MATQQEMLLEEKQGTRIMRNFTRSLIYQRADQILSDPEDIIIIRGILRCRRIEDGNAHWPMSR